ncbi:fungal trichothecene efflux pump [Aspergillus pseudodeflectus]|uniref:Fungal trichothecene efflux pump n=1 Tax=Aspergillus pseudodeflectus TaxID=176178 RepID=A0ABR4K350_9EURO
MELSTVSQRANGADESSAQKTFARHVEYNDGAEEAVMADADADADPPVMITRSTWAAVFFLGFTFQPALTFTVLFVFPVIIPIATELQGNIKNSNWLASGWSLGGSIGFAVAGQLSDQFGRRWILLGGQALLIIGYIVGATAPNLNQCIAAMAICGLGTGTTFVLYPGISELLPNKYRAYGLAWTELNLLPFTTLGPLLARMLTDNASWRWIFILGATTGAICIVGTGIFYHPPTRPIRTLSRREILFQLDYVGIFLYITGLTLFLLGLGWGGTGYPWRNAKVLAPMCTGAALFVGAFAWDFGGRAARPLFPLALFTMFRRYTLLLVIIFVTGVVYFTLTALMPQQISSTLTSDSTLAGVYNIPGGFGGAAGGVLLGGLIPKIKHVHYQLVAGVAVQTLFTALQAICGPGDVATLLVFQFLANLPFAWITLACYVTASLHVAHADLGLALGLIGTFRFLGSAVGTTVFGQILNNRVADTVSEHVAQALRQLGYSYSRSEIADVIAALSTADGPASATILSGMAPQALEEVVSAYRSAWSSAFRVTWLATIPFGVVACVLAFWVRDPSPLFTSHTAVRMEREALGGKADESQEGVRSQPRWA